MKIVYILRSSYGISGGATSFYYPSVLSKRHDVLVLEISKRTNKEKIVATDTNVKVKNVNVANQSDSLILNIYKELNDFKPDIVHMFQGPLCLDYIFHLKPIFSQIKWIIDYRSPHIGKKNKLKLKKNFFLQFYVDKVMTHSYGSLKSNMLMQLKKSVEIPPGVDTKLIAKYIKKKIVNAPKKFIYIGSLTKTRELNLLIIAFGNFAKQNKIDISLDIFGDGDDFNFLSQLIIDKDLSPYIFLKGSLPQVDLFKIIPCYDIGIAYVPLKSFNSAPSLKSLEYAASKIAIIASNTIGHKKYNQKYGFDFMLFNNDEKSINEILNKAISNEISNKHIEKNYNAVLKFDWEVIVHHKLEKIYRELL